MHTLLVLAGLRPSRKLLIDRISLADMTIAVDGGIHAFLDNSMRPDLLIGDLDSASLVENPDCELIHNSDQNSTDLQKALTHISHQKITTITVLGGLGGRADHLLNNLKIVARCDHDTDITFINDALSDDHYNVETIHRLTPKGIELQTELNQVISISGVSEFKGLKSQGLRWELKDAQSHLDYFSQSNEASSTQVNFSLESGIAYIAVYQ